MVQLNQAEATGAKIEDKPLGCPNALAARRFEARPQSLANTVVARDLIAQLQPGGDPIAFLRLIVGVEGGQSSDDIWRQQSTDDFETGEIEPGSAT